MLNGSASSVYVLGGSEVCPQAQGMEDDAERMLVDLFILRGIPGHIRYNNGPEFVARPCRKIAARCKTTDCLPQFLPQPRLLLVPRLAHSEAVGG